MAHQWANVASIVQYRTGSDMRNVSDMIELRTHRACISLTTRIISASVRKRPKAMLFDMI